MRRVLRKLRMDDAPAIFTAYAQDPEVTRYMTWRPHKNVEETCHIVELMLKLWDDEVRFFLKSANKRQSLV